MATKRKKGDATGHLEKGRHHFKQEYYEAIRAWLRVQIEQVQHNLDQLNAAAKGMPADELKGQRQYWANVLSYMNGIYRRPMGTVDAMAWIVAYTHVTVDERFKGTDAPSNNQPTPPGR